MRQGSHPVPFAQKGTHMSRRTVIQPRTKREQRPATPPPTPPAPPPAAEPVVDLLDDAPPADALSAMLAELSGGGISSTVTVYREVKGQVKPSYLFKTTPEGFSLDALRDEYGGGDFRLYITKNGGLYANEAVTVDPPRRAPQQEPQSVDIAATLRDAFATQADKLAAALQPVAARPSLFDPDKLPALITAGAGLVTAIGALIPKPPPAPPPRDSDDAVSMLLKGLDLGRKLQPRDDGDGGGLLGVVRDLAPAFAQAVVAGTQAPPHVQRVAPPPAAATPAIAAPQPTAAPPAPEPAPADQVAGYVAMLCTKADEDIADAPDDPKEWRVGLYADLILDNAPDAMLRPLLDGADPVGMLALSYPAIADRRAWFLELVEALRQGMADDDAADADGATVGRNASAVLQPAASSQT